jgi:hypothetical protein
MNKFMVMSATTIDRKSSNYNRCFETNALGFTSLKSARLEATRRNKIEKAAGHSNVEWYAIPEMPPLDFLKNS